MQRQSMLRDLSVRGKINLALAASYLLVMCGVIAYTAVSEYGLVHELVRDQMVDTADSYFDGINTLMLTGTMGQREILRHKVLSRPGMLEARIIRGKGVRDTYGDGEAVEHAADDLDRRALAGEEIIRFDERDGEKVLTVLRPFHARTDYRGTNCLLCHHVPEGTVLGAVRLTYSLAALEQRVRHNLIGSAVTQLALFGIGLGTVMIVLGRVVIRRIEGLRGVIEEIARDADLSRDIPCRIPHDEIGTMVESFNRMIARFREGMVRVSESTHELAEVTRRVSTITHQTLDGAKAQRSETDQVARVMGEVNAAMQQVSAGAVRAMEASESADEQSRQGTGLARRADQGIQRLLGQMEEASTVIGSVENGTDEIGVVLDVIADIAEQTNLLALNAAIEAARAGDQGRGFAVVADEVRTLAARTHESTKKIQAMIEGLQSGARNAVRVMDQAVSQARDGGDDVRHSTEALERIAGEIAAISGFNREVAAAAAQESRSTDQVSANLATIGEIADRTTAGAEQTAGEAERLQALAEQLEELVGRFRLDAR